MTPQDEKQARENIADLRDIIFGLRTHIELQNSRISGLERFILEHEAKAKLDAWK